MNWIDSWIEELDKAGKLKKEKTPEPDANETNSDDSDDSLLDSPKHKKEKPKKKSNGQPPIKKSDLRFDIERSRSERNQGQERRANPRQPYRGRGRGRGWGGWRGRGRSYDRRRERSQDRDHRERNYGPNEGYYPVRNSQPNYRRWTRSLLKNQINVHLWVKINYCDHCNPKYTLVLHIVFCLVRQSF